MQQLIDQLIIEFTGYFKVTPTCISQAPGRINIIGEHTDYTGGYCLPAAIDRWTVGAWSERDDGEIHIFSNNMRDAWQTTWNNLEIPNDKSWVKYVGGALALFKSETPKPLPGFNLYLLGNIPLGKGLSSSAAIELCVLNGANVFFNTQLSPLKLTQLAQQVEHRYLGVKSGLLDQFASQFSKKNEALLINFRSLETQNVPLAAEFQNYSWVLVDSLVKRELATSKYSERVSECTEILEALNIKGISHFQDLASADVPSILEGTSERLKKRAQHITSENERTLSALSLIKNGEVAKLGSLLFETHESLARNYEVSHPYLDLLVELSRKISGVQGARMMGGGFGGCCLVLVSNNTLNTYIKEIASAYESKTQLRTQPSVYHFETGASAFFRK